MSYANRITKATLSVLVLSLAAAVLGYLLRIYLARALSVDEFGLFYSVLSLTALLFLLKDFGLGPALAKYIPEFSHTKQRDKIKPALLTSYAFQFVVGVGITLIVLLASPYLASNFFKTGGAVPVLFFMMLEFLFASTTIKYSLQGLQFIKSYALMEAARMAIIVSLVVLFLNKAAADVALSYLAASLLVQIAFSAYIIHKVKNTEGRSSLDKIVFYKLLKFGSYFLYGSVAGFLIAYTDTLALTALRTLGEVGLYQVAISTSQVLWGIALALSVVLMPTISEMWAKNEKEKVSRGVSFLIKYIIVVLVPAVLLMISFSEVLVNILFGERYLAAGQSLQILAAGAVFYSIMTIYATSLASIGRPDASTKITIAIGALNLVANIAMVQLIGILGAAAATTAAYIVGFALYHRYFRHLLNVRINKSDVAKVFVGAVLSLLLLYALKEIFVIDVVVESVITVIAALAFYAAFALKTKIIEKGDIDILRASRVPVPARVMRVLERNSR